MGLGLGPPMPTQRRIRSFVRRAGRMTKAQRRALTQLWPRYGLELGEEPVDLPGVFGGTGDVVLDIGFGDGEALLQLARRHPDIHYLGVEVYEPGIGHLLLKLEAEGLDNVRVVCADAVDLLSVCLSPRSVAAVNLFFPDPWPKKRHFKRRIVQPAFIEDVSRAVCHEGLLHMATDWAPYAEHVRAILSQFDAFEEVSAAKLGGEALAERPPTKFEQRGLALGHEVTELYYRRR